jgi:hypothetical protein
METAAAEGLGGQFRPDPAWRAEGEGFEPSRDHKWPLAIFETNCIWLNHARSGRCATIRGTLRSSLRAERERARPPRRCPCAVVGERWRSMLTAPSRSPTSARTVAASCCVWPRWRSQSDARARVTASSDRRIASSARPSRAFTNESALRHMTSVVKSSAVEASARAAYASRSASSRSPVSLQQRAVPADVLGRVESCFAHIR